MLRRAMHSAFLASILLTSVAGQYQGFNYGATNPDGSAATQASYETQFNIARHLVGHRGFNSARLYTMIQYGTTNAVTEAIPAAISTNTSLLLGMWASAGQASFDNELAALRSALETYGSALLDLVAGLSVGSEDMYRITPTGIANHAGVGAGPDVISSYIQQTRDVLNQASVSGIKVGHVDTWTAWVNSSNTAAIEASDFCGMDAYPYFQTVNHNKIENGLKLFDQAYRKTIRAVGSCDVWITETGWPLSGPKSRDAVASVGNAKSFWDTVACKYLGKVNMWYYTLYDGASSPSFGLLGSTLSSRPLFNLRCPAYRKGNNQSSTLSHGSPMRSSSSVEQPSPSSKVTDSSSIKSPSRPSASVTSRACPTSLSGEFQYPHLMIPIDSKSPDMAYGTVATGSFQSTTSTIFNFDIPASCEGKSCSLVFLFPNKDDLKTSGWKMSGAGGIEVKKLSFPATENTSFNNRPHMSQNLGRTASLQPGSSYIITTGACAAGKAVSYEVGATGNLSLIFFQNWDPKPIGMYITVC